MSGRFNHAFICCATFASLLSGCSSSRDERPGTDSATVSASKADSATATTSAPASLSDDILAAENAWRIGVGGGDSVELGRITAPEFTMVGTTGPASTVTRANLMKEISQGMIQADSSSVGDLTVRGSGDTAIADLTFFWRVSRMGKAPKPETVKVEDTWVRRDGRWQLAARRERAAKP
jgi:hypothetical protein